ncbi:MAG: ABC transporter ATP-binding protein [Sarcina sp.]
MIEIQGISKRYQNKKVIDNVGFCIKKGELTSFIGPNGAGKSTVLNAIARLLKLDDGKIFLEGRDINTWSDEEFSRKISILKQTNSINARITIKELVSFGRFPYSKGHLNNEDYEFIDKAIDYMQLKEIENNYIDQVSGGQRQRAFIAMVIAQDTDYILLDEPLNNLDMKHSVQMMKVFRNLVDELNKTVVIVMHDINFASCYSDKIAVLKEGRLVKNSKTENIIDDNFLRDIYEIEFNIKSIDNKKICVYF